ncbi:hypothetical protein E2C01_049505 [Portunus trituberculatus]|uniref:Uncharacterized protein n=1 Tax=Portunus trituberculatus TaxID=210409 RepID=A0A5B7GE41_PORTR|nr:hypothetical protein [Portunus trituberculatus]
MYCLPISSSNTNKEDGSLSLIPTEIVTEKSITHTCSVLVTHSAHNREGHGLSPRQCKINVQPLFTKQQV